MKSKKKAKKTLMQILPPIIVLVILIVGLELIVRLAGISPTVLPPPSAIGSALVNNFGQNLSAYFFESVFVILVGFGIGVPIGIAFASLLSQFRVLQKTLSPYVIILCTTPLITLIPLFMLWLGYGVEVKILVVIVQVVPIITLNSITGFQSVERSKVELMDAYGATKAEKFFKVVFPNALPYVFTGVKLGCIFATIATVSCEFTGFKGGLGTRVIYYSKYLQTDVVFAVILLIALIGIILFNVVNFIESRVVTWKIK